MEVIKTDIEGVVIIEPKVFDDARGYFFESFSQRELEEKVRKINFVQDNESMSSYGVMRGLHFQRPPFTQSKLVRCVKGCVLDVAVDIRKGSPTYGKHVAVELSEGGGFGEVRAPCGDVVVVDRGRQIDREEAAVFAFTRDEPRRERLTETLFEVGISARERKWIAVIEFVA